MKNKSAWVAAAVTFVAFLLLGWLVPHWTGLEGAPFWILRASLLVLGLVAAFLAFRLLALRAARKRAQARDPEEERLDLLFREARTRLAAAGAGGSGRLGRLPVLLLAGPTGSTKTTVLEHSGLDPELLAGEVRRGDSIVPTEAVNLWYGDQTVFVEAGGGVLDAPDRWAGLLERLRPVRLDAALFRRSQAPRAALLCVSMDTFLGSGGGAAVERARALRLRLAEAASELGIQLPVYVLFTKSDQIPHFTEFVRNLTADEVAEALGATLPLRSFDSSGSYGEEQSRRVAHALEELHRALAARRVDVLSREHAEDVRQAAYEFPRELRKLADPMRDFLVELCRPGHLGASPLLRGFYFTGVRPVIVNEPAQPPVEEAQGSEPEPVTAGASSVFRRPTAPGTEAPVPGGASGGSARKVPQWVFLQSLLNDVVLRDGAAMGLTGTGVKVSLLRRGMLAGVAAASLVTLLGMTVSFFANRGLAGDVEDALRGVESAPVVEVSEGGAPEGEDAEDGAAPVQADLGTLRDLEEVGGWLDRLRGWQEGSPPLRYRWGLYRGDRILPQVRAAYFQRFEEVLWAGTRRRLASFLDALPDEPGEDDDYDQVYSALRAYLVTGDHADRSTLELAPVLEAHWAGRPDGPADGLEDDDVALLARAHFQRFARELTFGDPYQDGVSRERVARARGFLEEFGAEGQLYQALVAAVSREHPEVRLEDVAPDAGSVLVSDAVVPGAFTREGWMAVHEILEDPESLLESEAWVVGEDAAVSPEEREELAGALAARYVEEYRERWRDFLAAARVPGFPAESAAAERLDRLSRSDSPVLRVIGEVSFHTAVDSPEIRLAFRPVHQMHPPEGSEEEDDLTQELDTYLGDLADLEGSMDDLARASGDVSAEADQAQGDARQVERTVGGLARDFVREDGAAAVADQLERLLAEPVARARSVAGGAEARRVRAELNEAGRDFCQAFRALEGHYPFDRSAGQEADVGDVEALLNPADGRLREFHQEHLDEVLALRGGRYEADAPAGITVRSAFLEFINEARRAREALFRGEDGIRVDFALTVETSERIPEVAVAIGGAPREFTRTRTDREIFSWDPDGGGLARVEGVVDGEAQVFLDGSPDGPWAVFRLFEGSRWERIGQGDFRVIWEGVPASDLETEARVTADAEVFRPGYFDRLTCQPQVVQ